MRHIRLSSFVFHVLRSPTQRKHIFRWLNSFQNDYLLQKRQPWLAFDAIDFLNSLPLRGKQVFEYGSGGSTLYWLSRKMQCVSIEHNPEWCRSMVPHLKTLGEVDYRLIEPQESTNINDSCFADPHLYLSSWPQYQQSQFENYVHQIDDFPDKYFDVILVDGRARPSCLKHSVSKVKVEGILILDNAERKHYLMRTNGYLKDFHCLSFYGVGPLNYSMWKTNIYVRKK